MAISHFTVTGMTCNNCVNHVTEEVNEIPGVQSVKVELDSGSMVVESQEKLAFDVIQAAVSEAGDYSVVQA